MAIHSDMEWNIDMQVNLFHAMRGHKPAGVNRHFQMIAIHDKLSSSIKKVTSSDVWKHLSTLYDLQALNESEIVPFPNKSGDFTLVEKEMLDLCSKSFPRSSYINVSSNDSCKAEGPSGKTISKLTTKQESKINTPKMEVKNEQKASITPKNDVRSNTPSNRSDSKTSHSSSIITTSNSKTSQPSTPSTAPSPSPKRAKRTRNVNSTSASPATPTEPQIKRRR